LHLKYILAYNLPMDSKRKTPKHASDLPLLWPTSAQWLMAKMATDYAQGQYFWSKEQLEELSRIANNPLTTGD